ncbi:hypothetical protein ACFVZM_06680 [Streptomyces sioyaensis]|uniref:hypothetical protein n=1 Tax=Streptomyces sioyaensis TaxID=67364 RepID=UPI0036CADDF1
MSDGWKYIKGEPVWRPCVELAMAQITAGRYGDEYAELRAELEVLADAVRRECAAQIRAFGLGDTDVPGAADLVDPDKGES